MPRVTFCCRHGFDAISGSPRDVISGSGALALSPGTKTAKLFLPLSLERRTNEAQSILIEKAQIRNGAGLWSLL